MTRTLNEILELHQAIYRRLQVQITLQSAGNEIAIKPFGQPETIIRRTSANQSRRSIRFK